MNKIVLCYHIKQTLRRCHVIIGLFNNWSKEVSKYGMDISDTNGCALFAPFLFLSHFMSSVMFTEQPHGNMESIC